MGCVYSIHHIIVCSLSGQQCSDTQSGKITKPDCKNCDDYIAWKKSGKTIRDYPVQLNASPPSESDSSE